MRVHLALKQQADFCARRQVGALQIQGFFMNLDGTWLLTFNIKIGGHNAAKGHGNHWVFKFAFLRHGDLTAHAH
ncbi:hypothetical protein D3C76_1384520 [compost metagenome]